MAEQNGSSELGRSPDYDSAEYRAYRRAVDKGDVSFHQVASAWFDWHWGPDDCPDCFGSGWTPAVARETANVAPGPGGEARQPPSVTLAPGDNGTGLRMRCPRCQGRGRYDPMEGRTSAYEEIFHELLETFSEQRGGLITAYFCENIRVAAALTDIWSAADRRRRPCADDRGAQAGARRARTAERPQAVCRLGPRPLPRERVEHRDPHRADLRRPGQPACQADPVPLPQGPLPGARVPQAEAAQDLHADDLQRHHDAAGHARQPDRQGRAGKRVRPEPRRPAHPRAGAREHRGLLPDRGPAPGAHPLHARHADRAATRRPCRVRALQLQRPAGEHVDRVCRGAPPARW